MDNRGAIYGQKVRKLREAVGWTQIRLARESGLSASTIPKLEQGLITSPNVQSVVALSRALGSALGIEPAQVLLWLVGMSEALGHEEVDQATAGTVA